MDFAHAPKIVELQKRIEHFMDTRVYPAEPAFAAEVEANRKRGNPWVATTVVEELKRAARAEGLWNLFLPESEYGAGLTNLEYAPLCEIMGRSWIAPEAFNCSAPDTGNMEVLVRYATEAQKKEWLVPLLAGEIRSAFAMTEPDVASSDATNIEATIVRDGDHYVINGRKWWTSGGPDPRCKILIFMGKTDPGNAERHRQQSMILVPRDTPGVRFVRALPVFGYDDAPHGHAEFAFENVARARHQHPARGRPRVRNRAGTPRSRTNPSLHAPHRPRRARARSDVPAREAAVSRSGARLRTSP